jgi:hypothetical protein
MVCDKLFGEAEPPPVRVHLDPEPQGSGFGLYVRFRGKSTQIESTSGSIMICAVILVSDR